MNARGEVEWTPPPPLDTGQTRINYHHRPERLLRPPEQPEPQRPNTTAPAQPTGGDNVDDTQSCTPPPIDNTSEPGGPAPPDHQAA